MKIEARHLKALAISVATGLAFLVLFATPAPAVQPDTEESLVEGNSTFAFKLYNELKKENGNLFFSPYSISSAFGMAYTGAREETARELKKILHFPLNALHQGNQFNRLNKTLAENARRGGVQFIIANGLVLTGGDASNKYKTSLRNNFDAEIFPGREDVINAWVKQKTDGKIDRIVESLDPDSSLVILNAVYFYGNWRKPFGIRDGKLDNFNVSAKKRIKTFLMGQRNEYRILKKDTYRAISIPYSRNEQSLVVLLPDAVDGLAPVEKQLTKLSAKQFFYELDNARVWDTELYLPKFKWETGYDLLKPPTILGLKNAVSKNADFRGMTDGKRRLMIWQVKHKAFIDVNEKGTEAAAVTSMEAVPLSVPIVPEYQLFRVDRPFLFMIRDNYSGSILFMGRMVDPSVKN
ncbi:MAG: serpin family protein [Desulfuromonadaceae bacterium]